MSAPSKPSRWGSLLSQAVAGVEARLDNILADEEQAKQQPSRPSSAASSTAPTPKPSATSSKSANDRLQERLARAVAARNAAAASGARSDSSPARPPRTSIDVPSPSHSPRPSSDIASVDSSFISAVQPPLASPSQDEPSDGAHNVKAGDLEHGDQSSPPPATDGESEPSRATHPSTQEEQCEGADEVQYPKSSSGEEAVPVSISTSEKIVASLDLYERRISSLEKALEDAQAQHQEEIHGHVEQVDALQAKLQYLAREATDAARKAASAAPAGSLEKKLAEKDQQVTQLMEEGQRLAGNEQKLRSVIKKLRTQIAADEKGLEEHKLWRQKAEAELSGLKTSSQSADELKKVNDESQRIVSQLKRDLEKSKSNASSKDATILELKSQLQDESERAKAMAAKVNNQVREAGQQRIKELEEAVATLEIEKSLAADRAKLQAHELREKAEREAERSRAVELEMKGEVQILESKLEAVRARAEEASSGAVGDAQAKLLRQIETLQTQYSVASENWQGMEASLVARATNLERERDEALRRESDMRKKARETAARAKRQEEELEEAKSRLPNVQRDLSDHQTHLDSLRRRAEDAESALVEARAEFEKQRTAWKEDAIDRSGADRRPWLEDVVLRTSSRPASPLLSPPQRTFSSDLLGLQGFSTKLRKTSAPSSNGDHSPSERPTSARRPSQQPPRTSIFSTASAQSGTASSILEDVEGLTSPPTHALEREDTFDSLDTPASPHNVMHDMMSVSTIAAGPSVQLVERMSAAIRRLESEKVTAKEELARISSQRDEARAEMVALMKGAEAGRTAAKRVDDLEKEVVEINERYQTTLEMLGEKSELVEELRADVQDVKAMYRDLVERTIK